MPVTHPGGQLRFATVTSRAELSRLVRTERAQRLTTGVYVVGATLPPDHLARHHLLAIAAHVWPGGVVVGRSALSGGEPSGGTLFITHPNPPRRSPLLLPGIEIRPQTGPGAMPGDMVLPHGLWMSGIARTLVENVHLRGRPVPSRAGTRAVEDRIEDLARLGGAGRIQTTLAELDAIAAGFEPVAIELVRSRLAAVLGTGTSGVPAESRLGARIAGQPYDSQRLDILSNVVDMLGNRAPHPRPATPGVTRWRWLPFFEAYFSNFIEGTKFGIDEARAIVIDGAVPTGRPSDAHDIAATYQLARDPSDVVRVPHSGGQLLELLRERHAVLMATREDKRPGLFKTQPNFAGGYRFVEPELVAATLRRGFDVIDPLVDPFARATALMVLVTECHPFDDGNGRIARLFTNAELTAGGETRIVIPTVYRNNYLAALTGVSDGAGRGQALAAVLDFGQRWTAAIDWSTFEAAHDTLTSCDAYVDPGIADATGRRLRLPTDGAGAR